ncbi:uncharacterized protein TM35_000161890 [Trypanosoma theileri]|uniref:Uncharacterized protein n=1 Tax=Trypanosoma theileri TaxID=67003 RepID=A0A1X0NVB6_9TRYP|nr:uncharacterized protein TM35_000161890 [Trypanosoma theileri]ORC88551.1 hypothetical protein TM35_000161890 [Trypanosoma theileri]
MSSVGKILGMNTVLSNSLLIAPIPNDTLTSSTASTLCGDPVQLTLTPDGRVMDGVVKTLYSSSIYESAFDFPDLSGSMKEEMPKMMGRTAGCGRLPSTLPSPTTTETTTTTTTTEAITTATTPVRTSPEVIQSSGTPSFFLQSYRTKPNEEWNVMVSSFTLSIPAERTPANVGTEITQNRYPGNSNNTIMGPVSTSVMYTTPPESQQTPMDTTHADVPPCTIPPLPPPPPPLPMHQNFLMLNNSVGPLHVCSANSSVNLSQGLSYSLGNHLTDIDGEFNKSFSYAGVRQPNTSLTIGSVNTPLLHRVYLCGQPPPPPPPPQPLPPPLPTFDGLVQIRCFPDPSCVNTNLPKGNVHGALQGAVRYVPYNLTPFMNDVSMLHKVPTVRNFGGMNIKNANIVTIKSGVNKYEELPIFIQMFPCELRDRTIIVLNRVVEATCGPDIATVVGIEPRSETSFIALVRTNEVWHLIHKLRCRVLMDRHGFWYAENFDQYMRLKEYCEGVRRLPQQMRHFQTDGLPCMPLVVELSRSVDAAAVTSPSAEPSFDKVAPIATVERHRVRAQRR